MQIGDTIRFRPHAWLNVGANMMWANDRIPDKVTGTVVYVNEEHGIYRVAYDCHGLTQYETFKLEAVSNSDIQTQVTSPTPGGYKSVPKDGRSPWWAAKK